MIVYNMNAFVLFVTYWIDSILFGGDLVRTSEVVDFVAQEACITKKAASVAIKTVVKAIQDSLKTKDGMIRIPDLGTFKVLERKERMGTNPKTGAKIKIPGGKAPKFSASSTLKKIVAQGG
jgi:nucleoid DNA-binding protein